MIRAILLVVRNELLRMVYPATQVLLNEVDKLGCRVLLPVLEVKAAINFLNVQYIVVSIVLQNQLLQKQECSLVFHPLSDLDLCLPQMRCILLFAIWALLILDHKFDNKSLLQHGEIDHLFLDGQLDLNPLRMGLGPDESGVNQLHLLVEVLDLLEAVAHERT